MSLRVSEREHRKDMSKAVTINELKQTNDQPKNSNSGLLHFNKLVCYQFYINFVKFAILNMYHKKVI